MLALGILKLEVDKPNPCPEAAETQAEDQILAMPDKMGWRTQRRGSTQPLTSRQGGLRGGGDPGIHCEV